MKTNVFGQRREDEVDFVIKIVGGDGERKVIAAGISHN